MRSARNEEGVRQVAGTGFVRIAEMPVVEMPDYPEWMKKIKALDAPVSR